MTWTDEKVETLKKLWAEGKTASEISEAIGDKTRNAVIGKAHRLDLKSRPSPIKKKKSKKKKSKSKKSSKSDKKKATKKSKKSKSKQPKKKKATKKNKKADKKPAKKETKNGKKAKKKKKEETAESKKSDADYRIDSMLELKSKTCHWPFEDPKSDEFHFCGKPTWEGFPYCNEHAAKAYKKVKLKKKKKKA